MMFYQGQIAVAVSPWESHCANTTASVHRKSCGVMPYWNNGKENEFLLMYRKKAQYWSFPKGHMEVLEVRTQTAMQELVEERELWAEVAKRGRLEMVYDILPFIRKH